jgi:hypothetical protein
MPRKPKKIPERNREKQTINELKKQVKQLRKQNESLLKELDFFNDDDDQSLMERAPSITAIKCEKCKSTDLTFVTAGLYNIIICGQCSHKQKKLTGANNGK